MIEFKNVVKMFGDVTALNNISLTINDGEIFGLVGQSGAGKSTLLRTINQLEKIDSGEILVNGVDVSKLKGKELRQMRKGVAMIFQQFSIMETLTVYDNIALPLKCEHWKRPDIDKRVRELAEIVGLSEKLKSKPRELSGGQKQRVAIARSLTLNPKILLCDEATSALDPITTQSILDLLKKINKEYGITVIIVTHQMEVIKEACERIAIIQNGNLLEVGRTDDLFLSSSPALKTLIVDDAIVPKTGKNVKIYFPRGCTADSLITKMARTLNVDFSICWGKLERFQDEVLGTLIINTKEEDFQRVVDYLRTTDVRIEIMDESSSVKPTAEDNSDTQVSAKEE